MPTPSHILKILMPNGSEANVVPADLYRIISQLEPHALPHATDPADRDAQYNELDPSIPMIVSSQDAIWHRRPATDEEPGGGWDTVWRRPIYKTADVVTAAEGFSIVNQSCEIDGHGWASVFFSVANDGDPISNNSNGNIGNIPVATVASPFRPKRDAKMSGPLGAGPLVGGDIDTNGVVRLTATTPGAPINTGVIIQFDGVFRV